MRSASRYLVLGGICLVALTLYSTLAPQFELWQFVLVAVVAAGIGQLVVVRASQRTKSQAPIVAQAQRIDSSSSVVPAVEDTYRGLIDELGLDSVVSTWQTLLDDWDPAWSVERSVDYTTVPRDLARWMFLGFTLRTFAQGTTTFTFTGPGRDEFRSYPPELAIAWLEALRVGNDVSQNEHLWVGLDESADREIEDLVDSRRNVEGPSYSDLCKTLGIGPEDPALIIEPSGERITVVSEILRLGRGETQPLRVMEDVMLRTGIVAHQVEYLAVGVAIDLLAQGRISVGTTDGN